MELPIEHGLLLDNLLDLAHAPFTHTSTFAKGWSVPRFCVFFNTQRTESHLCCTLETENHAILKRFKKKKKTCCK